MPATEIFTYIMRLMATEMEKEFTVTEDMEEMKEGQMAPGEAEAKPAEAEAPEGETAEPVSPDAESADGLQDKEDAAADGETGEEAGAKTPEEPGKTVSAAGKPDRRDQQIEELNDKYRRLFAEFDNFRKRTEVEKTGMFTEGEKTVLLKVLPLIDNFERALQSVPEADRGTPFAEGIEKIYRSFTDQLKELGVTPIEAVGQPFDANLHNAVMHVEDEETGENTVVEEFQKGYLFRDRVLRYSMVKVAN